MKNHREIEQILRQRATAMATRDRHDEVVQTEAVVTFVLAGYCLGVPLARVAHVGTINQLSEIPGAPEYLVGAIVSRGRVVSLLDLALFLPLKRLGGGDVTAAITIAHEGRELGLAAEQLIGVEDIASDIIVGAGGFPPPIPRLAPLRNRDVLLLDTGLLLQDRRIAQVA
jgi:purine-binding chemotaxis protein CheW